jgi:eukaryotic-like serine/threonine-protein kinase
MRPANSPQTLKFGPFIADLRTGELRKNGSRIRLQDKPLRVLALLAEAQGDLVTREELKKHLWPEDTFVDFETGLNTAVKKLRGALADDAETPRYIETIPRRGYRFISPVQSANGDHVAPATSDDGQQTELQPSPTEYAIAGVEPAEKPRTSSPARSTLWVSLAAAIAVIAGVSYWLTHGRAALSFHSRDSVLIADFENQTGDSRFDNALGTAFEVSISQSKYANIYPRLQLDSVLKRMGRQQSERITPALGREICQREGVRGLIVGSITRTGQEYALTGQLIDPRTGEAVRSYTERSHGEDHILDGLDVLAKELREALGESLYQIYQTNKPLPQVTTSSLSALQHYAEGAALWHNGKYQDAGVQFKAALAGDPDFAIAHAALGRAYYSYIFNQQIDGQKEYEKALSLLSRTTEREYMIIETNYALDRKHVRDAELLFRAYLNRYPDDATMRFDYGTLLRTNGQATDAIEQYNQAIRVLPNFAHAYIGIATAYKGMANYRAALDAYAKAFEIDPQWLTAGNVNREYGFALVANGEQQKAAKIFSDLLSNPATRENGLRSLAFLDLYQGRYASAQGRLEESLNIVRSHNSPLSEGRVHLLLAIVAEGRGNRTEQRKELDAAQANLADVQQKVVFGAMLGDAYARAGFVDQAQKIVTIIGPIADQGNTEQMGYLHFLEGEIALADGKQQEAIGLLAQSDKENQTGFSLEAVAHAYQQSGDLNKAVAAYETMFGFADRSLSWEPQQRWLAARYTLAMDYSSRGDKEKARETLATLLNLWKDADPDVPLLTQAKAEYAKLQ